MDVGFCDSHVKLVAPGAFRFGWWTLAGGD